MFSRIRQFFHAIQTEYIPLAFELDLEESGKHVVRVCRLIAESRLPITEVDRLWTYGYREEIEPPYRIGVLRPDDRQTLLALKSLRPTVQEDGRLILEMTPQILTYLRAKRNIEESERARTWQVAEFSAQPTARIQFDPATGIQIEAGYTLGDDVLIPAAQFEKTADEKYFRSGTTFCWVPLTLSPMAQRLLEEGSRLIPLQEVPFFVQKDLATIKKEFRTIVSDEVHSLQVLNGRLVLQRDFTLNVL